MERVENDPPGEAGVAPRRGPTGTATASKMSGDGKAHCRQGGWVVRPAPAYMCASFAPYIWADCWVTGTDWEWLDR